MNVEFYKYQGTGNDFIMIDDRKNDFDHNDHQLINKLCSRKFGIGADGLILIRDHADHNFEMVYFNADGYQSSLCGNGGRCAVHFANYLKIIDQKCRFKAIDGEHEAFIDDLTPETPKAKVRQTSLIRLKMNDVTLIEKNSEYYLLDTGSPQYVSFVNNLTDFDVKNNGRRIRNSQRFRKEGINVNFTEKISNDTIFVRSYERGVEDETLSCGTGVTAAALTGALNGISSPVKIKTLGGELKVIFKKVNKNNFRDIYLIGPVEMIYKGEILLS